jgi:hypothetical protein
MTKATRVSTPYGCLKCGERRCQRAWELRPPQDDQAGTTWTRSTDGMEAVSAP